jgi:hypothetical protein
MFSIGRAVSPCRNTSPAAATPLQKKLSGVRALEAAGVEFTNGDEPGVKLKQRAQR